MEFNIRYSAYNEYKYDEGKATTDKMRQFTQLIWKDSFEVGMGKAVRVDLGKLIFKYYVVLFINPVGNQPDNMIANVKEMKEKGEFA